MWDHGQEVRSISTEFTDEIRQSMSRIRNRCDSASLRVIVIQAVAARL
jgi:hypothetical protein